MSNCPKIIISLLISLIFLFSLSTLIKAQENSSTDSVTTTIKLNVCGDGVIESPEDCEGTNLNGESCSSLGFIGGGTLSCDLSCEFNTSNCSRTVLVSTPTPTPTSDSGNTNSNTNSNTSNTISLITPITTLIQRVVEPFVPQSIIPPKIIELDTNDDGKITPEELNVVVKSWFNDWVYYLADVITNPQESKSVDEQLNTTKEDVLGACDINNDAECNLIDFSVLLYFMEK